MTKRLDASQAVSRASFRNATIQKAVIVGTDVFHVMIEDICVRVWGVVESLTRFALPGAPFIDRLVKQVFVT